jgi:hypothetical protein
MRSRCYGLLEEQETSQFKGLDKRGNLVANSGKIVSSLHRTVIEFLDTESVQAELLSLTAGTKFDADQALMSSCLHEMKVKPPISIDFASGHFERSYCSMRRLLEYCRHMAFPTKSTELDYYGQICNAMKVYWPVKSQAGRNESQIITEAVARGCERFKLVYPQSFLFYVGCHGLSWLLRDALTFFDLSAKEERSLVRLMLTHFFDEDIPSLRMNLAGSLENCTFDPDGVEEALPSLVQKKWDGHWLQPSLQAKRSLWQFIWHYVCFLTQADDLKFAEFCHRLAPEAVLHVITYMVEAGADLQARVTLATETHVLRANKKHECSPMAIVDHFAKRTLNQLLPQSLGERTSKIDAQVKKLTKLMAEKKALLTAWTNNKEVPIHIGSGISPSTKKGASKSRLSGLFGMWFDSKEDPENTATRPTIT